VTSSPTTEVDYRSLAGRVLVHLADYLARIEVLLHKHRAKFSRNDAQIVEHIRGYIDDQVRGPLTLHVGTYSSKSTSAPSVRSLAHTAHRASTVRSLLEDAHSALKHLDAPSALPETGTFLAYAWDVLRTSKLGEISNLGRRPPAVWLSHMLDPGEHILRNRGAAVMSVVALAKADYANPRAWPLLLHELGHKALRELDIPATADDDTVRQWTIEIGCDIIGIRLIGPAYYSAFLARVLVDEGFLIATSRHPSPLLRALELLKHLPSWVSSEYVDNARSLLRARQQAADAGTLGNALPNKAICMACKQDIGVVTQRQIEDIDIALAKFVATLDASFNLPSYPASKYALATELAKELQNGILVEGFATRAWQHHCLMQQWKMQTSQEYSLLLLNRFATNLLTFLTSSTLPTSRTLTPPRRSVF
jgi:hypothetical protein